MTTSKTAISYTRFSSAGQADGDSERRQVELAEAYAKRHGLEIDRKLSFHDHGVSAYDRSNLDKGALGNFLQKVQSGEVPPGSILLIENIDRLTRAIPLDAMALFTAIINAGLTIVTLHDGQTFNRETLDKNPYLLIGVFVEAIRGHSESKTKSKRVKEAWADKKLKAKTTGKVMTKKTPYWIKAKDDRSGFELITERAAVVMRLVEASEKGTGNTTLIAQLHRDGIEAWSKSGGWQPSYMQKLLRSPALYGAIRLNGEIVKGYYPPLIDEDRFHALQLERSNRRMTQATSGRGETLSNLFSGRLKCGYCGFAFNISGYKERARTPTRKPYERKYMGCHGARIKDPKGCAKAKIWFVDEFEPKVLLWLTTLDVKQLVGDDTSKLDDEKKTLAGLIGRLAECQRRALNIAMAIEEGDAPKTLVDRLKALEGEQAQLKVSVQEQEQRVASIAAQQVSGKDRMAALLRLFKLLKATADAAELKSIRQQLANLMANVVDRITLYPAGPTANGNRGDRYFVVTLKNGQRIEIDDSDREAHVHVQPEELEVAP